MSVKHGLAPAALMVGLVLLTSPATAGTRAKRTHSSGAPAAERRGTATVPANAELGLPTTDDPGPPQASSTPEGQRDPLAPLDDPSAPDAPSRTAWQVIDWVIATHDNHDKPFMVLDKVAARVFLFDAEGQEIAAAPVLVGMTVGDESTPGVGDRELSNIPPKDRKTPAGRFVAKFGRAAGGHEVLWVDYASAISIHAVVTIRNQHRLERLNSPTADDNRITYGCINVPTAFYSKIVRPLFKETSGIVYILPETKPLSDVFLAMPTQPDAPATVQKSE